MKGAKTALALEARRKSFSTIGNTKTKFHEPGSRNPKKGYKSKSPSKR